ncbi:MAG: endolytic transglycosylase MltG, partial [Bdellovibrionales bacterium]|nr:endolytic transglycosylase MltG [Bdellovibrionales bacterium]
MRSIVLIIVFCFVALFGWVSWRTIDFLFIPPSSDNTQVNFDIEPGTAFNNIAEKLYEQNFIKDKLLFKVLAKVMSATGTMRVGEYALNKNMTPLKILEVLSSGKSIQYSLTFQEGINMYEIALLIEQKNLGQRDDFLSLCKDKALIKELLNQDIESLEGYLFPETYLVTKFTGAKKLIQLMVGNFKKAYDSVSQSAKVEMPLHKLVTLASIIEKETGAPNERPMISSVFHNRLKKGMRLQSDPTIIYGIMDLNGGKEVNNIRKVDILTKTRYNTYKINGLPYGPIANPGIEALRAALNPADSDYLYFVSRNNGTHVFS